MKLVSAFDSLQTALVKQIYIEKKKKSILWRISVFQNLISLGFGRKLPYFGPP